MVTDSHGMVIIQHIEENRATDRQTDRQTTPERDVVCSLSKRKTYLTFSPGTHGIWERIA
jgi:hypothetical protein